MADTTKTSLEFEIELSLSGESSGGAQISKTRKVSLPILNTTASPAANFWKDSLQAAFLNKYKWIIQPASWRDSDDTEEAYQCVGAVGRIVSTTITELDTGQ